MKKCINAWCFPGDYSLEKCFSIAKECNYDGIELNMCELPKNEESDRLSLHLDVSVKELQEIADLSKQYDLPIVSISSALHWKYSLTEDMPEMREKGIDIVRKMIDAAVYFGSDTILVVPGVVTKNISYKTAYDRSQDAFRKLKEYAEQTKVVIGIENVWNKFLLSPLEMAQFIDKINSPYIKAYFDAGNVLQFSYPEHWVSALNNRIAKVHIKDFDTSIGNINGFQSLLQGDMDWQALMTALKEVGYDGFITAELPPYRTNPAQVVYDTAAAMDYILSL